MSIEKYIWSLGEFKTLKEAEKFIFNTKSTGISYMGIYQTSKNYSVWYMFKDSSPSIAKKFMQNPNREDITSPHTRHNLNIFKLWITQEDGKDLDKSKLVWTKEKGQIKQNPEPTLEETIKNYLKKQKQQRRRKA